MRVPQPPPLTQAMEDACLAVMVPLMVRALRERSTTVKRRASVIIGNMCKLVRDGAAWCRVVMSRGVALAPCRHL